jgi:hypothetical protein
MGQVSSDGVRSHIVVNEITLAQPVLAELLWLRQTTFFVRFL